MKGQQLPALHLVLVILGNSIGWAEGMTYDPDIIEKYSAFKNRYSISFNNVTEDAYRLEVFHKNVMLIEETNKRNLSYTLEVNKFAAMTQAEFARKMLPPNSTSPVPSVNIPQNNGNYMSNISLGDYPLDLNWVQRGAVNSPIDQGRCASCYAIAALGALEAACWAKAKILPKLSVQQIIDCSQEQGNVGCVYGMDLYTYNYIIENGIVANKDYPYEAKDQQCKDVVHDETKQYLKPGDLSKDDVIVIEPRNLEDLFVQLQKGPIVITVDTWPIEWQLYKGGIPESFPCQGEPGHIVLLAGYGVENGKSYWIIRNSWGTDWGEGGYARIIRDPNVKQGTSFCNMMYYAGIRIANLN